MEWPRVRLGDVAQEFISGGTPSTRVEHYWTGDIPWITGADVTDNVVVAGRKWITQKAIEDSATHVVPKGAILLVTRTGVGKVAKAGADIAISQDLTGIVLKEGTNADFVAAAIRQKTRNLLDIQQGAIIKGVLRKDVEKLEIPLPSLSEQRRIVEILDQADRLRCRRADADAKAYRILPALFIKMFGGPATNPMRWPVRPLRSFLSSVERRDPVKCQEEQFVYVDIAGIDGATGRIISTKKMFGHEAPSRARQVIRASDVLVSTVRPYLQATAIVPEELDGQIGSTGFCVLRSATGAGHGYLYALSRMSWFTEQLNSRARGASYPAVTDRDIWDLPVPLPDDFALLSHADAMVEKAMEIQEEQRRNSEHLQAVFKCLLHRAFIGDLTASWREADKKELIQEMER